MNVSTRTLEPNLVAVIRTMTVEVRLDASGPYRMLSSYHSHERDEGLSQPSDFFPMKSHECSFSNEIVALEIYRSVAIPPNVTF